MKSFLDVKPNQLRDGCILATIAHAIFTAHQPDLAHEQSWDDVNYNVQDSEGTLGTITFAESETVAAFFDLHSRRNPLSGERPPYDLSARLDEMPDHSRIVAEDQTLQYLLQDYGGASVPIITTCFWGEDNRLAAAEPWRDVFANGAHLIQTQLKETDDAIAAWRDHYGFSDNQVELLRTLFRKKIEANDSQIEMNADEKTALLAVGNQGLEEARELFGGIKIILP